MSLKIGPVMTLNADMTPLLMPISTTDFQQAINRIVIGVDDPKSLHGFFVVASYAKKIGTNRPDRLKRYGLEHWPSIVARRKYLKRPQIVAFNDDNLFVRDRGKCRYCGKKLLLGKKPSEGGMTKDHYIPKSAGGPMNWTNAVAACNVCNNAKDNGSPTGRWKLAVPPYQPDYWMLASMYRKQPITIPDEQWMTFLGDWEGKVTVR